MAHDTELDQNTMPTLGDDCVGGRDFFLFLGPEAALLVFAVQSDFTPCPPRSD